MSTMHSLIGRFFASVRMRLLALVLVAALPTAFLLIHSAYRERAVALEVAGHRMRQAASLWVENMETTMRGTQLLLVSLAQVDAVRAAREPDCSRLLSEIRSLGQRFTGFVVTDPGGATLCRTEEINPASRYGDRESFKAALATRRLAVSLPVIGRGSGKPTMPIYFPVVGPAGNVESILITGVNLAWLAAKIDETVPEITLPLLIFGREGKIFYRYPEIREQAGGAELGRTLSEAVRGTPKQETLLTTGLDGVRRIYGIAPLSDYPELGLFVAVGIDAGFVTGSARERMTVNLGILSLLTVIALLGAWAIGEKTIGRRIAGLVEAAGRIGRGGRARIGAPYGRDEFGMLGRAFDDMADALERQVADIGRLNADLERRVAERTAELEAANRELESFSYSVSHDLRAPSRHVQGYVELLVAEAKDGLSPKARGHLQVITEASGEMARLIDDLLSFSRMGRVEMRLEPVDLEALVRQGIRAQEMAVQGRAIDWQVGPLPEVTGDTAMLRQVLANLLGNAVKYTRPREQARIEVGCEGERDGQLVFFVRDNGVGFDMRYVQKLFNVFQRLHRADEFDGTGIGLANVRRVVSRHGGHVWAEGKVNEGAAFYFTLKPAPPATQEVQP